METGFLVRRRVVLQSVKTDNELSWSFAASDALSSCLEVRERAEMEIETQPRSRCASGIGIDYPSLKGT
jgi:hypothetical protein